MRTTDLLKVTMPVDLSSLATALTIVREMGKRCGFAGSALSEIEVGVEEAISNVIEHSGVPDEGSTFDLICRQIPSGIEIVLKEMGIPFDPERVSQFHPDQSSMGSSTTGMGLFLMQQMMDEVTFRNLGVNGKETRLVKHLKRSGEKVAGEPSPAISESGSGREDPTARTSGAEPEAPPPESPRDANRGADAVRTGLDIEIRLIRDEDAIEVSRCAFKSHGYTFRDDHVYYPERLLEQNRNGSMVSAVAVTKDGSFVGHAALVFRTPGDRIAEFAFAFVNAEYRGGGVLFRIAHFLVSTLKTRELDGVYCFAVTHHTFAQERMESYGMRDCGILLATSPVSWKIRWIPGDVTQRISLTQGFKYLRKPESLMLYAPPQHSDMIEKVYRGLGVEHQYGVPETKIPWLPSQPSAITTQVNTLEGRADIHVNRYGAGIVREIRSLLRSFCIRQISAVNLYLNLQDPATYSFAEEFEKTGFFFAGILPLMSPGEGLILQFLNNVELSYDKILVHSTMGQELLRYVKSRDPYGNL